MVRDSGLYTFLATLYIYTQIGVFGMQLYSRENALFQNYSMQMWPIMLFARNNILEKMFAWVFATPPDSVGKTW